MPEPSEDLAPAIVHAVNEMLWQRGDRPADEEELRRLALAIASVYAGEDDRQPDEAQEWRDYDPDC